MRPLRERWTPPGEWVAQAACAGYDPEWWFAERGPDMPARSVKTVQDTAKVICRACPVQAECLAWALEGDARFGIYGGLSSEERAELRGGVA